MFSGIPMNRLGYSDEVVLVIVFLASEHSSFNTGGGRSVDAGVLAK